MSRHPRSLQQGISAAEGDEIRGFAVDSGARARGRAAAIRDIRVAETLAQGCIAGGPAEFAVAAGRPSMMWI